jgi:membrane-associated phospholipid phosphatase
LLQRAGIRADDPLFDNDNRPAGAPFEVDALFASAIADRFRTLTVWLIVTSSIIAGGMELALRVRLDPGAAYILVWIIAALLSVSLIWWQRQGLQRIADVFGAVGLAGVGGMSCGIIAMLELRFRFPIADPMLRSWDLALGFDGVAVVEAMLRQGHWLFALMAPAYNHTLGLFFFGLIALALMGSRVEAWRAAFCFVGTLFTTCIIATFVPAKGIGVWATQDLINRLPPHAIKNFWPHFDEFYFGADPVLQLQAIDGVISFPSFHTIVGFMVLAMWRKNRLTLTAAGIWLTFMLLATLPGGGHYLVDLLGGFLVWAGWFALSRRIERQVLASPLTTHPNNGAATINQ